MKNTGIAIGLGMLGLGVAIKGLNLNDNQAAATTEADHAGPEEPRIVWYDVMQITDGSTPCGCGGPGYTQTEWHILYRGWSDGTVERKGIQSNPNNANCELTGGCVSSWQVVNSPAEGLNAAADINFDEIVDGADMGLLLGNWGKAPRSPIPASDCPLGLMQ